MKYSRSQNVKRYGFAAVLVLFAVLSTQTGLLNSLNRYFYDYCIRFSSQPPAENIVIVSIDQRSLEQLGRWPWPRHLHSKLLDKLGSFQPKVITFDIIFSEADARAADDDLLLAKSIKENNPVILPIIVENSSNATSLRQTLPLELFSSVAAGLGHVDTELDGDGIARSSFLKAGLNKAKWPTLALATIRATGKSLQDTELPGARNPHPVSAEKGIWVRDYQVLIPFAGPAGHFKQISFVDVLNGGINPALFKDKYVLVGATATGLGDTVPTPVSALGRPMPGVEYNAHILDALLQERLIEPLSESIVLLINIALSLICALIFLFIRAKGFSVSVIALGIGTLFFSYSGLMKMHIWFPPGTALFTVLLCLFLFNLQRLKELLNTILAERSRTQATLSSICDAVIRCDGAGLIVEINHIAEKLCDVQADKVIGKPVGEIVKLQTHSERKHFSIGQLIKKNVMFHQEPLILSSKMGKNILVQVAVTQIPKTNINQGGMIIVLTDISETERLAGKISYQETHNSLTGLPNSTLIGDKLQEALRRSESSGRMVAIVNINIDRFSKINESMGREAGDIFLSTIANRLKTFKDHGTSVGHIAVDEFILILEHVQNRDSIIPMVTQIRDALGNDISILDKRLLLSFTIGISVFPDDGKQVDVLLHKANTAMHRGKENGRNQTVQFTDSLQTRAERLLHVEQSIQKAIDLGQIETFFQPLVQADNLQIVGVEALMRLRDTAGEYISPDEFIIPAEESGQIVTLGNFQLYDACFQLAAWQKQGNKPLRLSYNLSPRQLQSPGLVENVEQILSASGLSPNLLEFEITENMLLENDIKIRPILEQLRELGTTFAIDDFGTGFSSMNYLTRFQFHRLKIDKSLVWGLTNKPGSRAITSSIINMVHNLDMHAIAEGVELPSQRDILLSQDCDEVQGFLVDRPMVPKELENRYI
jgi:diguanylate cyclase (GGDEF)-like protein/PAS domain S-box-containing protein